MARNALLSALQAAMLAGAGGVQGSIQAREREKKDVERQRELETQALRDALLKSQTELGQQQFGLQQQQFQAQYGPEALARRERETKENRAFELQRTAMTSNAALQSGREARQATEREQEIAGMSFLSENRSDPAVMAAIGAAISSNPELAKRPGLVGYQLMQQRRGAEEMDIKRTVAGRNAVGGTATYSPSAPSDATSRSAGKPSLEERVSQLRAAGVPKADAESILKREGYTF
jgi:hypothetical protein